MQYHILFIQLGKTQKRLCQTPGHIIKIDKTMVLVFRNEPWETQEGVNQAGELVLLRN